tara:strand:+ start:296 stop:997 length:702 start_codon:yes stop_codon:yes gene_type:complete
MKHAVGNDKLGSRCLVVSRAVGDSCPTTCLFLTMLNKNGNPICYADGTEKRFKNARQAGLDNLITSSQGIFEVLQKAVRQNRSVRIHERGDFFNDGELDKVYLVNWILAIKTIVEESAKLPDIWVYTHVYDSSILELAKLGVSVYASVHTENDIELAQQAGFTLFAYCTDIRKKKGGSKDDVTTYLDLPVIGRTLVCPEQRLGRKRVTCSGGKNTISCNWCVKGKGHVAFLEH